VRRWLGPAAIVVLGTNVWIAVLAVPAIHTSALSRVGTWIAAPLAIPLVLVALGATLFALGNPRARVTLFFLFPVSLVVAPIADPILVGAASHGGVTFALALVAFVAFLGAVAWLLAREEEPTLASRATRLRHPEGDPRVAERLRDRRLVLALGAAVPVFVIVLPLARPGGLEDIRRSFPDAAGPASAAIVALASALAAGILLVYFGPMLRRARAEPTERISSRSRLGWTLTMILVGAAAAVALASR
jgi:hypothetical protein